MNDATDILTLAHKFQIARMVDENRSIADIVAEQPESERAAVEAYAQELAWQRMTETD